MQNVKNVTTLILDGNLLSENAVGKLALMPNLQHLDLSSNGIARFVLSQNERERELFPCLRSLNLSNNEIEEAQEIQVTAL